jgi:hypothetical protein
MHYTQINRMKVVYVVQEYYLMKKKDGVTRTRIWQNVCRLFPMCIATFDNYLKENARKALKEFNVNHDELTNYKNNVIEAIQKLEKPII